MVVLQVENLFELAQTRLVVDDGELALDMEIRFAERSNWVTDAF